MGLADLARELFLSKDVEVDGKPGKIEGFKPLDMADVKMEDGNIKSVFIGKVRPINKSDRT